LRCWKTEAGDRPKIRDVKEGLDQLADNEKIYDKTIDEKAKSLIAQRKLKPESLDKQQLSRTAVVKQKVANLARKLKIPSFSTLVALLLSVAMVAIAGYYSLNQTTSIAAFLVIDTDDIRRYEIVNETTPKYQEIFNSRLMLVPVPSVLTTTKYQEIFHYRPEVSQMRMPVPYVVKLKDALYMISDFNEDTTLRVHLSDTKLTEKIEWESECKSSVYYAFEDSIFAVGAQRDYMSFSYKENIEVMKSASAHMYNTTTRRWIRLKNMNEPRLGHAVVSFKGLVCAVGGSHLPTVECFNISTGKWSYLSPMQKSRQGAVAVKLNDELYVIGGAPPPLYENIITSSRQKNKIVNKFNVSLESVEKYNSINKTWTFVAPLREQRLTHSAGVFNGKIYVIRGFSKEIENYDSSKNMWEYVAKSRSRANTRFIPIEP